MNDFLEGNVNGLRMLREKATNIIVTNDNERNTGYTNILRLSSECINIIFNEDGVSFGYKEMTFAMIAVVIAFRSDNNEDPMIFLTSILDNINISTKLHNVIINEYKKYMQLTPSLYVEQDAVITGMFIVRILSIIT